MLPWLAVFLGGGLGAVLRYAVAVGLTPLGSTFPWATLIANLTGCFLIGVVAFLHGSSGQPLLSPLAHLLVVVGILGGYTTFSAFSLQTLHLVQDGSYVAAGLHVVGSLLGCLAGVVAGAGVAGWLNAVRAVG